MSENEFSNVDNPSIFSLQKLVEVADTNMNNRTRYTWTSIWRNMGEHFSTMGSHSNSHVAEFSIDSLRQLAKKFIEKEELNNFNFQKEFLRPFQTIMASSTVSRDTIKEYIVTCMWGIVMEKTQNIKSGWTIILTIFKLAAQDAKPLVEISMRAMEKIVKNDFQYIEDNLIEVIACLLKFV